MSNDLASEPVKRCPRTPDLFYSDPNRFLRLRDVIAITGLSKTTIYRMMNEGSFPQSVKISKRTTAWLNFHVVNWQRERMGLSPLENGGPILA